MIEMRLIPSLDLRGGLCVRLLRGDFGAETRYEIDPKQLVAHYRSLGARLMHLVDLDGARDGALGNRALLVELSRSADMALQVGGGIRSRATVEDLLGVGIDRVIVGSAAIESPDEVARWMRDFGGERVGLALDVRLDDGGVPRVQTRGWTQATETSLWDALERYADAGLRHVLCTDIARDGALEGPNLALYAACVGRHPTLAWQASGGVRDAADLEALAATGVAGAVSGKALLEGRVDESAMRRWLGGAERQD